MVIGEMVPKNVAIADPERTLLALAVPNRAYVTLFGPVLRVLNGISAAVVRLLGIEPRDELATAASADELAVMLGASRDEGLIEEMAHQLLTGALDLGDRRITTVMVPRDGRGVAAALGHAGRSGGRGGGVRAHPAARRRRGGRRRHGLRARQGPARRCRAARGTGPLPLGRVRRMLVLGAATSLDDALLAMQRDRLHVAVVTDDEGRTMGIATLEDVIEALVGDIRDESDR